MKNLLVILVSSLCFIQTSHSATLCVNPTGSGGCYTSIQAAINAASTDDTVKVLPGTYNGTIVVGKRIILMGSGHEVTKIYSDSTTPGIPAVNFVSGSTGAKLMWFTIQSSFMDGIIVGEGLYPHILNNVVQCCGRSGIYVYKGAPVIANNVITKNTWNGIGFFCPPSTYALIYSNIISNNSGCGLIDGCGTCVSPPTRMNNCVFGNLGGNYCGICMTAGPGDIQQDPKFVSATCDGGDFHLAIGSPCKNSGREGYPDCDGTRGDMGAYGGPNAYCGLGPVVTNLKLIPPAVVKGETFDIQADGSTR